jgi:hypothetical protein
MDVMKCTSKAETIHTMSDSENGELDKLCTSEMVTEMEI